MLLLIRSILNPFSPPSFPSLGILVPKVCLSHLPPTFLHSPPHISLPRALLTNELETIFAEAPLAPNDVTNPRIREAHDRALGRSTAVAPAPQNKKRIPGKDDDCPICYDEMHGVPETALVFCEECGNALHKECFGQCGFIPLSFVFLGLMILCVGRTTSVNSGKQLNCVWCRARWVVPGAVPTAAAIGMQREGGYLNLGAVAGISPVRDTSTCQYPSSSRLSLFDSSSSLSARLPWPTPWTEVLRGSGVL